MACFVEEAEVVYCVDAKLASLHFVKVAEVVSEVEEAEVVHFARNLAEVVLHFARNSAEVVLHFAQNLAEVGLHFVEIEKAC